MEQTSLQWKIIDDSNQEHTIIYHGMNLNGSVKVNIDGTDQESMSTYIKNEGFYAKLLAGNKEMTMKISPDRKNVSLVSSMEPSLHNTVTHTQEYFILQRKLKSGRSSFLSMIILTLVNLILLMINSKWFFPFSAYIPQMILYNVSESYTVTPNNTVYISGLILAVLLTLIYLPLYFLSQKSVIPLWIALVLFSVDTLIFLGSCVLGYIIPSVIDIVYHVWVIWSLLKAISSYDEINRLLTADS